ncbi:hypothetical protein BX600DRAFT_448253 [Xylariales sp. PMI_506]|nr:hypothetical protein BX600DRAFT_448253 [Xylariales sp. PMI_506]
MGVCRVFHIRTTKHSRHIRVISAVFFFSALGTSIAVRFSAAPVLIGRPARTGKGHYLVHSTHTLHKIQNRISIL